MKPFILKLSAYLLLIALIFSYPGYILISSKENLYNIDNIYNFDSDQKYLVGYAYNEDNYGYLKYSHIIHNPQYTVWALGSSRVLQFREQMFEVPFYNAGYTIETIGEFEKFLRLIPDEKLPKYIIIGLDQWMFNQRWASSIPYRSSSFWMDSKALSIPNFLKSTKTCIPDLFNTKIHPTKSHTINGLCRVGLNAHINNKGFRKDGSMLYGKHIEMLNKNDETTRDYNFNNTIPKIRKGKGRWIKEEIVNTKALLKLNHLAEFCKAKEISLITFLPPYADKVYEIMEETKNFNYISKISDNIDSENIEFYSFNTAKSCGSNDNEMIDGFHGGEKTYLRILIKMLNQDSKLQEVCNKKELMDDLRTSTNNYIIYEY